MSAVLSSPGYYAHPASGSPASGNGTSTGASGSGVNDVDALISGFKWQGSALTFAVTTLASQYSTSIYDPAFEETSQYQAVDAGLAVVVAAAMAQFDAVSGLTITQTTNYGAATMLVGRTGQASTAFAYLPETGPSKGGDIWFGLASAFDSPVKGDYGWVTTLHEIGHALGLKHGHSFIGGTGAYYDDVGVVQVPISANRDSLEYSVMTYRSYVNQDLEVFDYFTNEAFGYPQTLMMLDIAAIQRMYGASFTLNSGDSTYTFSATTGEMSINGVGQGAAGANRIFLTIWDGGGNDTYDFANYTTNMTISLAAGGHSVLSSVQLANLGQGNIARGNVFNALLYENDLRSLIENAFGGSGNDTIEGNQADNRIRGNAGNDSILGVGGNDTINGGAGLDIIDGGAGNDFIVGGTENDSIVGGADNDNLNGDAGNDTLDGGTGNDFLYGGADRDTLNGGDNDDVIDSTGDTSAAGDVVDAGAGNDFFYGSNGGDTAQGGSGVDNLEGRDGADSLSGGVGADFLFGQNGSDTLNGGDDQDYLYGGADGDTLNGDGGEDFLYGGTGNDQVNGGEGGDYLYGEGGSDTFNGGNGNDFILATGEADGDTGFGGAGSDYFFGGNGNDNFRGEGNDDVFVTGGGADTIYGGAGQDYIWTEAGADVVMYEGVATSGYDVVYDFADGLDRIGYTGGNTYAALVAAGRIGYDAASNNTIIFDLGTTASGIILLNFNRANLTAADFVLI